MNIESKKVATIHYTLKNDAGETLDSSREREPLAYIQGIGNIIPGLEKALEGKAEGDNVEVTIKPEEGYGERNEQLIQSIPKTQFEQGVDLKPGMQVQGQTEDGRVQVFTITDVADEAVTIDGNHPLAGETLHFNVDVVDVRDAEAEELDHGHVHGPGGHEH